MSNIRPGILSSKRLRESETRHPLRGDIADFIDGLASQYDALGVLHSTVDPEMTKTGHAVRVKNAVIRAMDSNGKRAIKLAERLADHESNLLFKARERAGLLQPFSESHLSELRSALRQMTQADRERAIKTAFDKNDNALIRAIQEASSPVLVGSHKLALDVLMDTYLHKHNPELMQDIEENNQLVNRLDIVSDSFVKSVQTMRDVELEEQAEKNKQATREAMSILDPLAG